MSTDPKNLVGVTLSGRYRIERPIGEGGMGAIFEATQLSLGRHIAIKVVKPAAGNTGGTPNDENVKRFERETEVIAKLAHPNIVQVVDAGRADDGTLYLAMELLDGENVRQVLRRERTIDVARALAIVEDVASALVAAHRGGVIHRDLKCENVMLVQAAGKDETAKVLDFGVAKLTSQTEAPPVTGSGFVAGTPGCIAPEQMLGKNDDPRSDLYSLGVMLFEMLAGRGPFVAGSTMELMLKHLSEPAPRVADIARQFANMDVPPPVDALVASLLAKDPAQRPPDAQALRDLVRSMRDASRSTQGDIALSSFQTPPGGLGAVASGAGFGLPIGSRVVASFPHNAAPAGTPSSPPPGAAPLAAPSASQTNPTPPSTSPTTSYPANALGASASAASPAAPAPGAQAPARRSVNVPKPLRAAGVAVVVLAAVWAFNKYSKWSADVSSHVPVAKAAIARAEEDLWNLDLQNLDMETQAAVTVDPDAPRAHVLRAIAALLAHKPLVRFDAELELAQQASDRRTKSMMGVQLTATADLIQVLQRSQPKDTVAGIEGHCVTFDCSTLDANMFVLRLLTNGGALPDLEMGVTFAKGERPLSLLTQALVLERKGPEGVDEARRLLEQAEQLAPGRPALIEALVDSDLQRGDLDGAIARLEKIAARDDAAGIRLAALRARKGGADAPDAFKAVAERVRGLPAHDDQRVEGLASIGDHLAALGRFKEAEAFWHESIEDRAPGDAVANARALELVSVGVLFGLVAGDHDLSRRWYDQVATIPYSTGPGANRVAAFLDAARALMNASTENPDDLKKAETDLMLLEQSKTDVAILLTTVRYYIAAHEHRLDDAARFAQEFTPCFRDRNLATVQIMSGKTDEAAASLARLLAPDMEHYCLSGDGTLNFIEQVSFVATLGEAAALAYRTGKKDEARRLVERFHRIWPNADPVDTDVDLNGAERLWGKRAAAAVERQLEHDVERSLDAPAPTR